MRQARMPSVAAARSAGHRPGHRAGGLARLAGAGPSARLRCETRWPYMGGPGDRSLHRPSARLTVFVFFGLVAVMGTDWVLTGQVGAATARLAVDRRARRRRAGSQQPPRHRARRRGRPAAPSPWCSARLASAASSRRCWPCPSRCCRRSRWASHSARLAAAAAARAGGLGLAARHHACAGGLAFNAVLFAAFRLELHFATLLAAGALWSGVRWEPCPSAPATNRRSCRCTHR